MSFGPSQAQKNATNTQNGITSAATGNSQSQIGQGTAALTAGQNDVNSGTNFFNTLLNGNQANTTATLQPNIDQIRQANQQTLQQTNMLSPRGGGRGATLFNAAYAPNQQINSLFGQARTNAATALPQIGLAQQGIGTNLIGAGNTALNTAGNTNQGVMSNLLQQQQMQNQMYTGLGQGLFGLATTPFGGGSATNGLLGKI